MAVVKILAEFSQTEIESKFYKIFSSPMSQPNYYQNLLNFLRQDLSLSAESLAIAERTACNAIDNSNNLPIILWQYGLISLEELDRIFDWLEKF